MQASARRSAAGRRPRRRIGAYLLVAACVGVAAADAWARPPAQAKAPASKPTAARKVPPPRMEVLELQVALDRAGFSPGALDGKFGPKTTAALHAFQRAHDLPNAATPDAQTATALRMADLSPTGHYTIAAADLKHVGAVPTDWNKKAELKHLPYESLVALLAERGHCTQAAVAWLNPGRDLAKLSAGDTVVLPNVSPAPPPHSASVIEVDLTTKIVRAKDKAGRVVAHYPCSIAKFAEKRPRGSAKVTVIAFDPVYVFDPAMWPEVRSVKRKLVIPPGPRNPVGLCWIGLSLPGYGIHGTPSPELIGKTGSHGCIRLANWDAMRLGKIVRVGTPVKFVNH